MLLFLHINLQTVHQALYATFENGFIQATFFSQATEAGNGPIRPHRPSGRVGTRLGRPATQLKRALLSQLLVIILRSDTIAQCFLVLLYQEKMPPRTPKPIITVDPKLKAWEQKVPLHNRWHPEIPWVRFLAVCCFDPILSCFVFALCF
jgi:hypothetical protein